MNSCETTISSADTGGIVGAICMVKMRSALSSGLRSRPGGTPPFTCSGSRPYLSHGSGNYHVVQELFVVHTNPV